MQCLFSYNTLIILQTKWTLLEKPWRHAHQFYKTSGLLPHCGRFSMPSLKKMWVKVKPYLKLQCSFLNAGFDCKNVSSTLWGFHWRFHRQRVGTNNFTLSIQYLLGAWGDIDSNLCYAILRRKCLLPRIWLTRLELKAKKDTFHSFWANKHSILGSESRCKIQAKLSNIYEKIYLFG